MSRERAVALIREGKRFLVTCHVRPDADALGSALGLAALLRLLGKEAVVYSQDGVPPNLSFLVGSPDVLPTSPEGNFDATFVMDAAARVLVPVLPPSERSGPVVVVDHHAAHDGFGDVIVREIDACATGEVVLRMWRDLSGEPVPREAAQPIYAAMCADTGGFRYPGTTGDTMRIGAGLLDAGVSPWSVASHLFERWPRERMALLGEVLRSIEVHLEGRVALVCVPRDAFNRTGATDEMLEGMVNYGRMLEGVVVAALLWVPRTASASRPEIKISFRSDGDADVAAIAVALGGGGHRVAAGASLTTNMEDAHARVLAALRAQLDGSS
ncbi:MAG: DHH family phosphoesterase [Deltaproteobacteria bacterium]|nr:DHH family phosphoesterase [Deltaproteobacteria bacterium]